jgi:hypothetical protein
VKQMKVQDAWLRAGLLVLLIGLGLPLACGESHDDRGPMAGAGAGGRGGSGGRAGHGDGRGFRDGGGGLRDGAPGNRDGGPVFRDGGWGDGRAFDAGPDPDGGDEDAGG